MSKLGDFNTNFNEFIENIKDSFPENKELIDSCISLPIKPDNTELITAFYNNSLLIYEKLYTKDETIFSEELIPNIVLSDIVNIESLDESAKSNIWKNLHTLYLYSFTYINNKSLKSLFKENSDEIDDVSQKTLNILELIKESSELDKQVDELTDELTGVEPKGDVEGVGGTGGTGGTGGGADFNLPGMDSMFGGVIGNLANEIAGEINTAGINFDNPEVLLKNLLSGNMGGEDNGLGNLVKNIASKVQSKLANGDINEELLLGEAKNIMGGFDGDLLSNLMGSMMSNNTVESMFSGASAPGPTTINPTVTPVPTQVDNRDKLMKRRERLRKKLEDKKKLLKNTQKK